jgi:hypothetical protein
VHAILEAIEALPCRLPRSIAGARRIDRRLDELHGWNVARAILAALIMRAVARPYQTGSDEAA